MSKISIIVPVYNKGEFIKQCLESILEQTHKNFELIIINDGSQDKSEEIINAIATTDQRIIVIHQANYGVSAARNAGLEIASGEYIGFVDADDLVEDDMYELLLKNMEKHDADISICGVRRIFPHNKKQDIKNTVLEVYNRDQGLTKFFQGEILMSTYEKLFRKDLVSNIKYRPALFEDTFYNFEALKGAKKIVFDGSLKYKYIIRDNSHSMASYGPKFLNTTFLSQEMVDICKKEHQTHLGEAKGFDFNLNMFVLNLIILSNENHKEDYDLVTANLKKYKSFYRKASGIKLRYKKGFSLFLISPKLYTALLRLYTISTKSAHNFRKKQVENF